MPAVILPKNTEFDDGKIARGTDVRTNDFTLRDFLNGGLLDSFNININANFNWGGLHNFTASNGIRIPSTSPTIAQAIGTNGTTGPLQVHDGTMARDYLRSVPPVSIITPVPINIGLGAVTNATAITYNITIPLSGWYRFSFQSNYGVQVDGTSNNLTEFAFFNLVSSGNSFAWRSVRLELGLVAPLIAYYNAVPLTLEGFVQLPAGPRTILLTKTVSGAVASTTARSLGDQAILLYHRIAE